MIYRYFSREDFKAMFPRLADVPPSELKTIRIVVEERWGVYIVKMQTGPRDFLVLFHFPLNVVYIANERPV
jgi:hypothetical protein